MAIYFQVISTFFIAYICVNMGIINAWPSSTVLLFKSANTTLNRPMRETEISLLGSLPAIGCLIGNPIAGFILDKLGRTRSSIFASLMFVVSWSIIAATSQVEVVLVGVLIGGLGSAVFLISTVFISEICEDSIRGTMTAAPIQFYSIGFLISYLMGGYLDYYWMVYTCLAMAIAGVLVVAMMKETPISLMTKGKEEDVAKSIAFYRRRKSTSKEVIREMDKIRRILSSDQGNIQSLTETQDNPDSDFKANKLSRWQFFKNSTSTQRELFVVMVLKTALVLQGLPVVQVYATPLFAQAVPSDVMAASDCSILLGVVALFSGFIGSFLTDAVGRRPLIFFASIIAGLCCIVLGMQLLKDWGPSWMVPVFIYLYTAFYTIGAGTVPTVVLSEVFMPEVKSIMSMLVVEWAWICNFMILFIFHPLVSAVGLPPVFFFFAVMCFGTSVFCHYQLPETKGLPLDAIQVAYRTKLDVSFY